MGLTAPKRHQLDRRADKLATRGEGDGDEFLSTTQVADWLEVSTQFLEIGRHRGYGPQYVRLGPRRIRYRRGDVQAWLKKRTHQSTAEYA